MKTKGFLNVIFEEVNNFPDDIQKVMFQIDHEVFDAGCCPISRTIYKSKDAYALEYFDKNPINEVTRSVYIIPEWGKNAICISTETQWDFRDSQCGLV